MRPAGAGLAFGLLGGGLCAGAIRSMLYRTQPLDWSTFLAVAVLLSLVACAACALPAWRASHLDAIQALRSE